MEEEEEGGWGEEEQHRHIPEVERSPAASPDKIFLSRAHSFEPNLLYM